MAKGHFSSYSESYIFEGAGGSRDALEQTILKELEVTKYPLKAQITTIKAGSGISGALFGSKEQCITIDIDKDSQIVISNTTVGTYLYVEIYLMFQEKSSIMNAISQMLDDTFRQQKRRAYYRAAISATESAFFKLGLKQQNYGYKSLSNSSDSNEV